MFQTYNDWRSGDSVKTSEFGHGTLTFSRCLVGMLIGFFGLMVWNDRSFFSGPRSAAAACCWIVGVTSLIVLSWYILGLLMRSSFRSLSYDEDGLWRTVIGKSRGLLRWRDICRIKELSSALVLVDREGNPTLEVEYEREGYFALRRLIMERMSFSPPKLPLILGGTKMGMVTKIAFAGAAAVTLAATIYVSTSSDSYRLAAPLACCAIVFGFLAIPRPKIIIETECLTIVRRTYSYSSIQSVEASFLRIRSQDIPRLMLEVGAGKPVTIVTRGLPTDTLTLQRTILWALSKAGTALASPPIDP